MAAACAKKKKQKKGDKTPKSALKEASRKTKNRR
jgi:hypothetical protein